MARPTVLTPELQATIVAHLEAGNYRTTACAAVGIHRHTLSNWEKAGLEGREPYVSFLEAVTAAEARAEVELLAAIRGAQPGTPGVTGADLWTTKAWILERRFGQRWCARVKQQTAEAVDALTDKLKAQPDLHQKVMEVLMETETAGASH